MKPGRSKSPGRFLPIATFWLAVLVLAVLAGLEFGLIESPFGGDDVPKPESRAKQARRPVPKPGPAADPARELSPVVVHDEEAGEPSMPPDSPAPIASGEKAGGVKEGPVSADPERLARRWKERLGLLHRRMHNRGVDAESVARKAVEELGEIVDPRAAPALWQVFAGHPSHHLMVAERLAKLGSPRSSLMLAALAAYSPVEKARRAAVEGLKARDPVEFAGPLIALLGPELKYRAGPLPTVPGGPILQALEIEDERFIKQFVYFAGDRPDDANSGPFGTCPAMPSEADQARAGLTQELADAQLQCDIVAVDALNRRIRAMNDRARTALAETTGRDYQLDRDAWNGWLASKMGKTYVPPRQLAKVPFQEFVEPIYVPTFVEVPPVPS